MSWLAGEGAMEGTVAAGRQYQPPADRVKIWVCEFVCSWFCAAESEKIGALVLLKTFVGWVYIL